MVCSRDRAKTSQNFHVPGAKRWLWLVVLTCSVASAANSGKNHGTVSADGQVIDPHITPRVLTDDPHRMIGGKHDIDGYTAAIWLVMRKRGAYALAHELIDEGLTHNPGAFQLHYLRGSTYLNEARAREDGRFADPDAETLSLLKQSVAAFTKGAHMGFDQRDKMGPGKWSTYLDDDLRGAARMSVMMEHRFGDPETARARAVEFSNRLAGDAVLRRYTQP